MKITELIITMTFYAVLLLTIQTPMKTNLKQSYLGTLETYLTFMMVVKRGSFLMLESAGCSIDLLFPCSVLNFPEKKANFEHLLYHLLPRASLR